MQPHIFISSHVCPSLARSLGQKWMHCRPTWPCSFSPSFLFSHLVLVFSPCFHVVFHIVLSPCLFTLFLSFHLILVLFLSYSCLSSVCMFLNLLSHIPLLSSVRTVVHNANSILLTTKEPNSSKMMTMDLWLILIIALLIIIICLLCHITKIKAEEEG